MVTQAEIDRKATAYILGIADNAQRAAREAERNHTMNAETHEAQQVALKLAAICGKLCAVVEWVIDRDGECLGDNPRQLAYAKDALAQARALPGVAP
jgi:hypothetical protein